MTVRALPAVARRAEPWRNGGGITYPVARCEHPERPGEFLWRVSLAEVCIAGPFSRFAGYERLIAVFEGRGMTLRRPHRPAASPDAGRERARAAPALHLAPFSVHRFSGDEPVAGELPLGAVKDFNVIFDPARCRAELTFHDGPGRLAIAQRESVAVNVSAGSTRWRSVAGAGELAHLDALRFSGGDRLEWSEPVRLALVILDY